MGDGQPTYAHILVKDAGTAEKRAVIDANVPAEQTIIRDDHMIADLAVVADMRADHQKVFVADSGHTSFGAAAMDGAFAATCGVSAHPIRVVTASGTLQKTLFLCIL